jgi:hypothetical protein
MMCGRVALGRESFVNTIYFPSLLQSHGKKRNSEYYAEDLKRFEVESTHHETENKEMAFRAQRIPVSCLCLFKSLSAQRNLTSVHLHHQKENLVHIEV